MAPALGVPEVWGSRTFSNFLHPQSSIIRPNRPQNGIGGAAGADIGVVHHYSHAETRRSPRRRHAQGGGHPERHRACCLCVSIVPRSSGSCCPFRRCPPLAAAQACPTSRTESAQNPGPGRIRAARASAPPARSITCRSTIGLEAGGTSAPRWTRALANGGDEKRVAAVGSSSRKENGRAARRIRVRRAA